MRIISVSLAPAQLLNNIQRGGQVSQFARAGFTSVTVPEFNNSVIEYRENLDNYVVRKIPGLQRYNDLVMTRGVVSDRQNKQLRNPTKDFYRWLTRVNSPNPSLSLSAELGASSSNNRLLRQSENFRKDMIIILRDREGKAARRWYILNAFVVDYKGSTDLNALEQTKAVESVTLTYELAFELPSATDVAKEFIANITDSPFADIADDLDFDLGF